MTEQSDTTDSTDNDHTRRAILAGAAGIASIGATGLLTQAAAADPAGQVGTSADPYQHIYMDTASFVGRTTDPSSPADGTIWYRSDL